MSSDLIIVLLVLAAMIAGIVLVRRSQGRPSGQRSRGRPLTPAEQEQQRKSVRIPVSCAVLINSEISAKSREVGAGGMSMYTEALLRVSQPVHVEFVLPPDRPISIPGVVWWQKENMVGIRFDVYDKQLFAIRNWVEEQSDQLLARTAGAPAAGAQAQELP